MKTIHIDVLDPESCKNAVAELQEIKREWKSKADEAAKEVCREIGQQIIANLEMIPFTDDVKNVKTHEVIQKREPMGVWDLRKSGNGWSVTIKGKDIVFVEFGAGAYYNHGNENPLAEGVEFETDIGTYGRGQGLNKYWFVAHNLISCGTPMYMPIYRAILAVKPEIPTIVRKVFV